MPRLFFIFTMDPEDNQVKIKELVYNDLCIRRVPKKDLDWFKQYANDEYEGDYGMTLKELIHFYRGMYTDSILEILVDINQKIDKLQKPEPPTQPQTKSKRMADGTERTIG
jgi:hypothetical protein